MKPWGPLIPSKPVVNAEAGPTAGPDAGAASAPEAESELVRRAQAGDEHAFGRLVSRHGDRAYALALRIVRSASDAEEVAQDAFVRAWRGLPRFRGESAFGSWLYRIVARQAFDRAAVLRGRRAHEADIAGAEAVAAGSETPSPDARARARRLERLMTELPEVQRAVVTLYYYQDRSVEEVARTLGVPKNTVKTHLSRARFALRGAWTREEPPA